MLSQEVAFSALPLLPSLYFVQTNAFQESQSSLRRWRAGIPRLPIVTGMERAAWQADHPGWSTACPAGLEGRGGQEEGEEECSVKWTFCCGVRLLAFLSLEKLFGRHLLLICALWALAKTKTALRAPGNGCGGERATTASRPLAEDTARCREEGVWPLCFSLPERYHCDSGSAGGGRQCPP